MYILPKNNLHLLPKPLKDAILEDKDLSQQYDENYKIIAVDLIKEHTWIPLIKDVDMNVYVEFLKKFDMKCLSEEEFQRNEQDITLLYEFN